MIGEYDDIHSGKKRRIERQHSSGLLLVLTVAECIKARGSGAEIDDDEKESRKSIDSKSRTDPGQPDGQSGRGIRAGPRQQPDDRNDQDDRGESERSGVNDASGDGSVVPDHTDRRERKQCRHAREHRTDRHLHLSPHL